MSRYRHLMFVCQNERDAADPRGSCTARGAPALLDRLKALVKEHRLKGAVRITGSGCLDLCAKGCSAVVWSEAGPAAGETWYTHLGPGDADALFERHVLKNERLTARVEPQEG